MTTETKPFRWSFSQWENYNGCPARWKYKSVLKLPSRPAGPAAARGLQIHATIEDYISQRSDTVHPAVKPEYMPVFDTYREHPNGERHCELKFSLDENFQLCGPMLSNRAWCVMVLDVVRVGDAHRGPHSTRETPLIAHVGEWKSGKPKDTHTDQRKLYALGSLVRWPDVEKVMVTTHYVEGTAPSARLEVSRSAKPKLEDLWRGRVEQMQRDQICAPKPGMHCQWCDYSKRIGGPCVFGA